MRSLLLLSLSLRTNQPTNFAFKREPRKKNEEYLGRNANATWVGLVLLLPNNAETKRFKFNFNPPNSCFDGFALAYILFLFLFLFFLFSGTLVRVIRRAKFPPGPAKFPRSHHQKIHASP